MGKKENKGAVRDLVESGAVSDMGWDEKEVWSRAEDLVKSWKKKQKDMRVVVVEEEVAKLRKNEKRRDNVAARWGRVDTSDFERVESSQQHLCLMNSRGEVLGYRIRLPSGVFETFRRSAAALPRSRRTTHCRDRSSVQHWVVWSDYSPKGRPRLSKQYREANGKGDGVAVKWIEENQELVRLLSNTLRMISPHKYARGVKAGEQMEKEEGLEPSFQAWCGVALNEGMMGEGGMVHKDAKDFGMNCAVPWGNFTGGDVVLLELKMKVEVKAGDAFFFRGDCLAHKREAVQGVRGLADIFTHKNVVSWYDKAKSRERRHKKTEFRKKNK